MRPISAQPPYQSGRGSGGSNGPFCRLSGDNHCASVNATKGYGFIQPQAGGKDVFVHISAVERAGPSGLNEGQVVEYEEVANKGKNVGRKSEGSTLILLKAVARR